MFKCAIRWSRCESFTSISIDSLLVYEIKYYRQVYLNNCACRIVDKQFILMIIYLRLINISFLILVNVVLR